jgi:hypothetical protein
MSLAGCGRTRTPHGSGSGATPTAEARTSTSWSPGWPYSFVVALETGRSSWTAPLDAVRLAPGDDAATVTAAQLRDVVARLMAAGHWSAGDPDILIVADAGYDAPRLAWLLRDLPMQMLGRMRSDRVLRRAAPPRAPGSQVDPVTLGEGQVGAHRPLVRFGRVPGRSGTPGTVNVRIQQLPTSADGDHRRTTVKIIYCTVPWR